MSEKALINPIRISLMLSMTEIAEIYAQESIWAARIASDKVNERGGILDRPLKLIIESDGSLPQSAMSVALKLIDKYQCTVIIGNSLSNSRIISIIKQVAELKRTPLLNSFGNEGSLSSRYFFHFAALPSQQIDKIIPYLAQHSGSKIWNGISTNIGEGTYHCVHAFAKAVNAGGAVDIEAIARTHPTQVNSFLSRCNTNGTFSVIQDLKSILPKIPRRYKDHVKINLQQVPPCNC